LEFGFHPKLIIPKKVHPLARKEVQAVQDLFYATFLALLQGLLKGLAWGMHS
jgi:hypothetical protein